MKMMLTTCRCTVCCLLLVAPLCAQDNYLPLKAGNRWTLTSSSKEDMFFEIVGQSNGVYQVNWNNPWIKAAFGFKPDGERVVLASLDMGSGMHIVPGSQIQFDFQLDQGKSWSNALGTFTITKKHFTLSTPAGRFDDCIMIRGRDKGGMDTFWTFAPEVGFVQWGEGGHAFLLKAYDASPESVPISNRPSSQKPVVSISRSTNRRTGSNALLGLDANPSVPEGYSQSAVEKRFRTSINTGVGFLYVSPKWNELQSSKGTFTFDQFDSKLRLASNANIPVALNIRVIDTNNKAFPPQYSGAQFDDQAVIESLKALLKAVRARTGSSVRWIEVGNEVNAYLDSHRNEIPHYYNLVSAVLPTIRENFPGAQFTVNFTADAIPKMRSDYGDIASLLDLNSFTYYPMDSEFRMKDPAAARGDFAKMVAAANGKNVFIQEVGYPSDPKNGSSEEKQAQFVTNVFQALAEQPKIIAANFVWMSDLPESVVDEFSKYYRLANNDRFRAYIGTLGMFDRKGSPKQAWTSFQAGAAALKVKQ
jgi:hypothetical protein